MTDLHEFVTIRSKLQRPASVPSFVQTSTFAVLLLSAVLVAAATAVRADDGDQSEMSPDHPLFIWAIASTDRLFDRFTEVLQASGKSVSREEISNLLSNVRVAGAGTSFLTQTEDWLDSTKPFGMMFFYGPGFDGKEDLVVPVEPGTSPEDDIDDESPLNEREIAKRRKRDAVERRLRDQDLDDDPEPVDTPQMPGDETIDFEDVVDGMPFGMLDAERIAMFAAVKDYAKFLEFARLTSIPGKPNGYRINNGDEIFIRRFGDFILAGKESDLIEHCPDPRGIVRSILGKNDFVASFQTKGLPPLLRTFGAEGIKAAFDALLQKRDDEPERTYKLRRAMGGALRDLLEVVVSHIDEINLAFRIEPKTMNVVADLTLEGPNEGKLAKFASELTPKRSPFDGLWNPKDSFSFLLSLALPERHASPLASAIREYVAKAPASEIATLYPYAPMIEAGCKILDSRQLDLFMTASGDESRGETILGLSVPGGVKFPEQFQRMLEDASVDSDQTFTVEPAVAAINSWPVHRVDLLQSLASLWKSFGIDATPSSDAKVDAFVVATAHEVYFRMGSPEPGADAPETLKTLIERSDAQRGIRSSTTKRLEGPLRMLLHTRGMIRSGSPSSDGMEIWNQIQELYETKSDGILLEVRPVATGLQVTLRLDEFYLAVLAAQWEGASGGDHSNHSN